MALVFAALLLATVAGVGAENPLVAQTGLRGADVEKTVITTTQDSILSAWYPGTNYEPAGSLELRSGGVSRPVLKFDVSEIDCSPDVCVCQVKLRLYVKSRSNPANLLASAYAITRSWQVDQVTWLDADDATPWQVPGCDGAADRQHEATEANVYRVEDWIEIDVTDIVAGWLDGTLENNGLIVIGRSGTSVAYVLASSEYKEGAFAPQLEVVTMSYPLPEPTEIPEPILGVTKIGPTGPLHMGDYYTITYDITVTNPGSRQVEGVVVTDVLPLGTEFLGCTDDGVFDEESSEVVWEFAELGVGGSETMQVELGVLAWVRDGGVLINLVRATYEGASKVSEGSWAMPIIVPTIAPSPTPLRMYMPQVYCP